MPLEVQHAHNAHQEGIRLASFYGGSTSKPGTTSMQSNTMNKSSGYAYTRAKAQSRLEVARRRKLNTNHYANTTQLYLPKRNGLDGSEPAGAFASLEHIGSSEARTRAGDTLDLWNTRVTVLDKNATGDFASSE